jgi:transposase
MGPYCRAPGRSSKRASSAPRRAARRTSRRCDTSPDTVLRWHRDWLRRRWTRRSRRTRDGRPTVNHEIRALVSEVATANPLWGAPRIHGELRKLGCEVSERTVSRLLPRRRRPPSQTWRTFLTNHLAAMVSMDFFTVSTRRAADSAWTSPLPPESNPSRGLMFGRTTPPSRRLLALSGKGVGSRLVGQCARHTGSPHEHYAEPRRFCSVLPT